MIRQNQDNKTSLRDFNLHIVFPGMSNQRYVFDSHERALSQKPVASAENSNSSEDGQPAELYSPVLVRTSQHWPDVDSCYKPYAATHSPAVSGHSSQSGKTDTYSTDDCRSEVDKYADLSPRLKRTSLRNNSGRSCVKSVRTVYRDRSPSPARRHSPEEYPRSHRDGSDSPQSPPYSSRPVTQSHLKHGSMFISPLRSVSRECLRDHFSDKSSVSSDYLTPNRFHEASRQRSPSPHKQAHRRRSSSSESYDVYEPEVPPTKKCKRVSPPPYIPTSIKPAKSFSSSHLPKCDVLQTSDSEEEDPIALRNKLLAEVIEKRKTLAEVSAHDIYVNVSNKIVQSASQVFV